MVWSFFKSKRSSGHSRVIHTGLRAIDLFAPIPCGGDVLISGDLKSGTMVLGKELAVRLMNSPDDSFRVIIYLDEGIAEVESQALELKEVMPSVKSIYVSDSISHGEISKQLSQSTPSAKDVIIACSERSSFIHLFREAIAQARTALNSPHSLTSFVFGDDIREGSYDAKIISNILLAKQGIYPALDTLRSFSTASTDKSFSRERIAVAKGAKEAIDAASAALNADGAGDSNWILSTDPSKRLAAQAMRFMSQPMFVGEPYTGLKAEYLPIEAMVKDFQRLLAGEFRDLPPAELMYKNHL